MVSFGLVWLGLARLGLARDTFESSIHKVLLSRTETHYIGLYGSEMEIRIEDKKRKHGEKLIAYSSEKASNNWRKRQKAHYTNC